MSKPANDQNATVSINEKKRVIYLEAETREATLNYRVRLKDELCSCGRKHKLLGLIFATMDETNPSLLPRPKLIGRASAVHRGKVCFVSSPELVPLGLVLARI